MRSRAESSDRALITDVQLKIVVNGTSGLLAWASCVVAGAVKLQSIAVRRGERGLFLTFPRKCTSSGEKLSCFHPVNQEAARALQDAIVSRLAVLARVAAADGESKR